MFKLFVSSLLVFYCIAAKAQPAYVQWAYGYGSSHVDFAHCVKTDNNGNIYITGKYNYLVDFAPGPATYIDSVTNWSCYILKLNTNGQFVWLRSFYSTANCEASSLSFDKDGNILTTGNFIGTTDFDPGPGVYNLSSNGNADLFVSKLDSAGNFLWAKGAGSTNNEAGASIIADNAGNIYTTGYFNLNVDFDPGPGVFNLNSGNNSDPFILKLDPSGNFIWAKNYAGPLHGRGITLKMDETATFIYCTGQYRGTVDFDLGPGVFNMAHAGIQSSFVTKIDTAGNLKWVKNINSGEACDITAMEIDDNKNIYTVGNLLGEGDFDMGPNYYLLQADTSVPGVLYPTDFFILKTDSIGNLIFAKLIGGAYPDYARAVSLDSQKNVYITGMFEGDVDFDPGIGTYILTSDSSAANYTGGIFVMKLDSVGNFKWAKSFDGVGLDKGSSLATDKQGNLFLAGEFEDTVDFDDGQAINNITSHGAGVSDAFILKINGDCIVNAAVTQTGPLLTASPAGGNYQWLQCPGFTLIQNEISQNFSAMVNGEYAVIVTQNGCVDTSACVTVAGINVNNIENLNQVIVFPNPGDGIFTITVSKELTNAKCKVYNVAGEEILKKINLKGKQFMIDLSKKASGVYFAEINDSGRIVRFKIAKQ